MDLRDPLNQQSFSFLTVIVFELQFSSLSHLQIQKETNKHLKMMKTESDSLAWVLLAQVECVSEKLWRNKQIEKLLLFRNTHKFAHWKE